ncbi:hypothetical protein OWR29_46465 [Actinoplanes sp. Pm04-4]|uniref:Uncharacterized protein n=1 Tax=Paractinoplanes pyxinae TaxID=2997416 RepID=A0ABT4BG28_9ACTN|nr:hypothetical protein [Actinoplanes pyxinae]MCY1145494.1 hypothetical protein [Actinoplanes pyxinae]
MSDWQDWYTPPAEQSATEDRAWRGAAAAAVPHVVILLAMMWGVLGADGADRAYAALYGLVELYVVPVAVVVTLFLAVSRRRDARLPMAVVTLVGSVVVSLATLIIGNGSTWT